MMQTLSMRLGELRYDITVGQGLLASVGEIFSLDRRVLVLTDDGVPPAYAQTVAAACRDATVLTVPQGEGSKSMATLEEVLAAMLAAGLTRTDAVVAVGGGVVGDLAGFAAACYMRGIDFYNVPTTLLSQVDSSIGGKTGVNFRGVKNILGAFHQPRGVLIDPDLLKTLPPRQMANGLAEVIKMAATSDPALFCTLEEGDPYVCLADIIPRALAIKRAVVEADPKENGLRRVLNFGHTAGHGIESAAAGALLHGECVALGMLPLCSREVRERLLAIYRRVGLPTECRVASERILDAVTHDKKRRDGEMHYVYVPTPGRFEMRSAPMPAFLSMLKEAFSE